ncbi:MAG: multidrug effflux MFS transporter [Thalassobaculum sp.]|uniref:multidrug effflux MFS transporter n=1 Tax=Thalassobaculum sp. TaxID=2022740 RepID=UPI0032EEE8DB
MNRPRPDSVAVAALLTTLVAFGPISTDMYLPSLPALVTDFGSDVPTVQLTLSAFLVAFAVAMLAYGPLSDRFGRRPVLIGAITVYLLASVACALAPSIEWLIAARVLQAVGCCAGPVLGRAVVRDVYGRDRAATVLSYMGTAMALAPAIGPIAGGWLQVAYGWQATFWVLTAFSGLALVGVLLMLDETNAHRNPHATSLRGLLHSYRALLSHRGYLGYVATISACYSVIFSFISGSSFVLIEVVGLSADLYGMCFATMVIGYMSGTFLSGRFGRKVGIDRLILAGAAVSTAAGLAMAGFAWAGEATVATIVLPQIVAMFGVGLVFPNCQAGAIGPFPTMAGAASALLGFSQMGVAAAVGLGIGYAFDGTARPMATGIALASLLTLLSFRVIVWPLRLRS